MKRKRFVTAKDAPRFVHEDTARTIDVPAGHVEIDGERVPLRGNMTYTLCGYWFNAFEGHEKYWRWNKEGRKVDCPECLARIDEEAAADGDKGPAEARIMLYRIGYGDGAKGSAKKHDRPDYLRGWACGYADAAKSALAFCDAEGLPLPRVTR